MGKPGEEVLQRFFADESAPSEVRTVHEWFANREGQRYLSRQIDKDFKLLDKSLAPDHPYDEEIDSAKVFNQIIKAILQKTSKE